MTARPYTPAEDAFIAKHFRTRTLAWIAAQLGRKPMAVVSHSHVLERRGVLVAELRYTRRPWTPTDDQELRGRVGWQEPALIAREMHRTVTAVKLRAKRLGLSFAWKGRYSARDVGRIFDVDAKTVLIWVTSGFMAGQRSSVRAGATIRWEVRHEAVEAFIREHPERYVRSRIREDYWRRLADAAEQAREWVLVPEAARLLGVCQSTVLRHLRRGWLPGERIPWAGGQAWRIRRADLAHFKRQKPPVTGRYVKGRSGMLPRRVAA